MSQVDSRICSAVGESLPCSGLCLWCPGDPTATMRGRCCLAQDEDAEELWNAMEFPKSYSILRDPKLVLNLFTCHSLPFTLCCICCASSPQAARKVFDQLETDDRLPTLSCIV